MSRASGRGRDRNRDIFIKNSMEKDEKILKALSELQNKADSIDRHNKKFLMAVAMQDGKSEMLEKKVAEMKIGIMGLLDQIDVLLYAVKQSGAETIKKELDVFYRKVAESTEELGLEKISPLTREKFNPELHKCAEMVAIEGYDDDMITELLQKGYADKNSGTILRYANVIVNKNG